MDNQTVIRDYVQKADLQLAELTSGGGALVPAQAKKFFQIMIEASVLLGEVDVVTMAAPQDRIDRMGFLNRIMRRGTDGAALSLADRSKPDLSKVELNAKEIKGEVDLTDSELEDNIEGNTFQDTVKKMMAERMALDVEDLVVNGDTTSSDALLVTIDGILKQVTTNVVDLGVLTIARNHFFQALRTMPKPFVRDKKRLRFLTGVDAELKYRDILGDRATNVGDKYATENAPVAAYGVPVVDVPIFPENLGVGSNETNIVLTDPMNIAVGVWRKVTIERERNARAGVTAYIGTMRLDTKFKYEPAVVKVVKVTSA